MLRLAAPKTNASTSAAKKAKTAPATTANASKALAKKSIAASLKSSNSGFQSDSDNSDVEAGTAVPSASGTQCPVCGKPGAVQDKAQQKPESDASDSIDFSGQFAWFNPYSDELTSVLPEKNPTAAQWATVYSHLTKKLASDASHRPSFTLKLGYRGKSAYIRGPKEKPKTMADSALASRGAEIVGGFVGDVEFTDDDIPAYYDFDVDLSCVHGYEARLAVPPRMGLRGGGEVSSRCAVSGSTHAILERNSSRAGGT